MDVPYSDWGDFRRRHAVDISSLLRSVIHVILPFLRMIKTSIGYLPLVFIVSCSYLTGVATA